MLCHVTKLALVCFCISLQSICMKKSDFHSEGTKTMSNQKQSAQPELGKQPNRPQEPKPPFPYNEEEVSYANPSAGVTLSGTLTLPCAQQLCPAVLLIAGYGRHDRNVTGMGHNYFLVLADYLTRQGIAVLRVDKRGVGKSTGNYDTATSQDFASDVQAGVEYLKARQDINPQQIGLVGLSEGGLIASIVASESSGVAFILLMAPAVLSQVGDLLEMTELQLRADGASEEFIKHDRTLRTAVYSIVKGEPNHAVAQKALRDVIANYLAQLPEAQKSEAEKLPFAFTEAKADTLTKTFNSPWYRFFLAYDPTAVLKRIKIPVLVMNGDRDWIVTPQKAFPVLEQCLKEAGNKDYTMLELPNINHMFQSCNTGALMEYATIEETISPSALKAMSEWILARTINK